MTNAELIQTIRAEIERRVDILATVSAKQAKDGDSEMSTYYHGKAVSLEELISFLSTLESEKPVPADLEEAAKKYATEWHENPDGSAWKPYFEVSAIKAFIAGAKWQKEQDMDEWLKDRDGCFWDGVEEGKKAMKEQMLKEAVAEVEVGMRGDPIEIILDKYVQRAMGIFPRDKVRIIVLPKED